MKKRRKREKDRKTEGEWEVQPNKEKHVVGSTIARFFFSFSVFLLLSFRRIARTTSAATMYEAGESSRKKREK